MSKAKQGKKKEDRDVDNTVDKPTEQVKLLDYTNEEDEDEELIEDGEGDDDNVLPAIEDDPIPSAQSKKKAGVVYLGNLPPGLKPNFVKSLLSKHGNIKRQYLEPEDEAKRKRRIGLGGSSGLRYAEGWVEFETKKEAKEIAQLLNNTRIGRRKGSRFYDDLWMVKYLKGFTWEMLVEKTIIQRKEREQRLRLELQRAKKEDEEFLQSVAKAKRMKLQTGDHGNTKRNFLPRQLPPIGNTNKMARPSQDDE